jgi:cell division septation protein DedD
MDMSKMHASRYFSELVRILLTLFFWIFIFREISFPQLADFYIKSAVKGDYQVARTGLEKLQKSNRIDASVLFLAATLEPDGDKSLEYYKKIIKEYPDSKYYSSAILKSAEYYFTRGLYVQCQTILKPFVRSSKRFPELDRALDLLLKSLYVIGQTDTMDALIAEFGINKKNVTSTEKEKIPLDEKEKSKKSEEDASIKGLKSTIATILEKLPRREKKETSYIPVFRPYHVQVGAFGNQNNALKLKRMLENHGYEVTLKEKQGTSKALTFVWVESFEKYDQAMQLGKELKEKFDLSYIVVKDK